MCIYIYIYILCTYCIENVDRCIYNIKIYIILSYLYLIISSSRRILNLNLPQVEE